MKNRCNSLLTQKFLVKLKWLQKKNHILTKVSKFDCMSKYYPGV